MRQKYWPHCVDQPRRKRTRMRPRGDFRPNRDDISFHRPQRSRRPQQRRAPEDTFNKIFKWKKKLKIYKKEGIRLVFNDVVGHLVVLGRVLRRCAVGVGVARRRDEAGIAFRSEWVEVMLMSGDCNRSNTWRWDPGMFLIVKKVIVIVHNMKNKFLSCPLNDF